MSHNLLRCALVVFAVCCSVPATADMIDYDANSSDWTGLSRFVDAGRTVGVTVIPSDKLDYRTLDPDKPLVIVYPRAELQAAELARWVSDGGRLLLADDFGMSESLLERLAIQRIVSDPGNLPHQNFANDNEALPVIRARGRHALLEGVESVIANHPTVITNVGGPVLRYDGGGGIVYDMNLGRGKVVVVADASIFINQMMSTADNELFAANALRYICRDETPCEVQLFASDFTQTGHYSDSPFDVGDGASIDSLNELVGDILDALPAGKFLYWMTILLACGLALYLGTVFPIRRTRPYSSHIADTLAAVPWPQSEFDWNVSRFGGGSRTMNYALPMAILKEIFEELFLDALGYWPSRTGERPEVKVLAEEFANQYLADRTHDERNQIRDDVVRLLATFAQLPPRPRVFLDNDTHFSESDLLEHYRRAQNALKIMGLSDEYQRRTRGII